METDSCRSNLPRQELLGERREGGCSGGYAGDGVKLSKEVEMNFGLTPPQGTLEHTLIPRGGPILKEGSWVFVPPCQSGIDYGFLGSRGQQFPFHRGGFSGTRGNGPIAINAHSSWGWVHQRGRVF